MDFGAGRPSAGRRVRPVAIPVASGVHRSARAGGSSWPGAIRNAEVCGPHRSMRKTARAGLTFADGRRIGIPAVRQIWRQLPRAGTVGRHLVGGSADP
jgi:hypothetical protein